MVNFLFSPPPLLLLIKFTFQKKKKKKQTLDPYHTRFRFQIPAPVRVIYYISLENSLKTRSSPTPRTIFARLREFPQRRLGVTGQVQLGKEFLSCPTRAWPWRNEPREAAGGREDEQEAAERSCALALQMSFSMSFLGGRQLWLRHSLS